MVKGGMNPPRDTCWNATKGLTRSTDLLSTLLCETRKEKWKRGIKSAWVTAEFSISHSSTTIKWTHQVQILIIFFSTHGCHWSHQNQLRSFGWPVRELLVTCAFPESSQLLELSFSGNLNQNTSVNYEGKKWLLNAISVRASSHSEWNCEQLSFLLNDYSMKLFFFFFFRFVVCFDFGSIGCL